MGLPLCCARQEAQRIWQSLLDMHEKHEQHENEILEAQAWSLLLSKVGMTLGVKFIEVHGSSARKKCLNI